MGDPGGRAYVMVSGKVRLTTIDEDHQEVVLGEPEAGELFGAAELLGAVVENGGFAQEFEDRFTAGLVPNFVKPANHQRFVLFRSGKWLGSGRHINLL